LTAGVYLSKVRSRQGGRRKAAQKRGSYNLMSKKGQRGFELKRKAAPAKRVEGTG